MAFRFSLMLAVGLLMAWTSSITGSSQVSAAECACSIGSCTYTAIDPGMAPPYWELTNSDCPSEQCTCPEIYSEYYSGRIQTPPDYAGQIVEEPCQGGVYLCSSPPTVTLSFGGASCSDVACPLDMGACGEEMPGTAGGQTVAATITFSEAMQEGDLTLGDLSIGTEDATLSNLQTSDNITYTVDVTSASNNILLQLSINANAARAAATGLWNAATGPLEIRWGTNYWKFCDIACSSIDVPDGYELVLQSDESAIPASLPFGDTLDVRIKKSSTDTRVVDFSVYFAVGGVACNFLDAAQVDQKSLLHGFDTYRYGDGTYALYVPKIAEHTALRVCAGKNSIGCLSSDDWSFLANEAGTITATRNEFDITGITVAVAGGYWKVSGLTGTSAEGEEGESGASSSSVPFFPLWALPIVLLGGGWVLKREGVPWR